MRREKILRLEEDIKVLRKCVNMCATAIQLNEDTMKKINEKMKEMETGGKMDEIDRMFS